MPRRERIFVRRQNLCPAMRLDIAGAPPPALVFQRLEQKDARNRRRRGRTNRLIPVLAAVNQQDNPEPVPKPAIPSPSGKNRQNTQPAGRAPAVEFPHQAVIVRLNVVPEGPSDSHTPSSKAGWDRGTPSRAREPPAGPKTRTAHRLLKASS